MLTCANNANSAATSPVPDVKKPNPFAKQPGNSTKSSRSNEITVPDDFKVEDLKFDSSIVDSFVPPDLILGSKLSSPSIVKHKRQDAFTKAFKSFYKPFNNFRLENNFFGNKDESVLVAGKRYENADDFLRRIKHHKAVHVEDLTPEMKREVIKLYELVSKKGIKKGIKFTIFCANVSEEENKIRIFNSEVKKGHKGRVAVNTLHKDGRAIDFFIEGATSEEQRREQRDEIIDTWEKQLGHKSGRKFKDPELWHLYIGPEPKKTKPLRGQKNNSLNKIS